MPRRIRVGRIAGVRLDEMQDALGTHPYVLAGSCFVLGLVAGMVLKDAARQTHERTVEYDENLPDSLTRREPAPDAAQPRYGGTGALGVSPAAVRTAQPEERK